ncbi:MAG TPA: dihydropteroate synthase, partial [Methanomicrobiales archaeon]|nr:dihydropteroate synthase [Methanomicrobiales archaeon]
MHILLPTGAATARTVQEAARGYDATVVITGEVAAFLTPRQLRSLIEEGSYDMVIVSGMSTASFQDVERETGVPIYRGPKHAADLSSVLALLDKVELSRTIPADEFLADIRRDEALSRLSEREEEADSVFLIRGLKIGGSSRMKVLAEIMDAPARRDLREEVERYFRLGADIVDLGFG